MPETGQRPRHPARPVSDTPSAPGLHLGPLASELALTSLTLARRFYAGATLWCWSPDWPQHAQHVAVEFVHPVIVGKRALPARALRAVDPVAALRTLARRGDVLVTVATAEAPIVGAVMRRARAWGVDTVWIGSGPRPPSGAADHVLWMGGRAPSSASDTTRDTGSTDTTGGTGDTTRTGSDAAAFTGELILVYHLLWELTHVCFEHPGLLKVHDVCEGATCITCADEAHLGEIERLDGGTAATVRTAWGSELIDTTLVGPVRSGDLVLIHAGVAIDRVDDRA